jgi:sialate O-acetylesterase
MKKLHYFTGIAAFMAVAVTQGSVNISGGAGFTLSSSSTSGPTHDNLPPAFGAQMASGDITPTTTSELGGTYAISNISDGERVHANDKAWASATAASCSVTLTFASTDISGLAFNWAWGDRTPGDYEIVINGVTSLGTFTVGTAGGTGAGESTEPNTYVIFDAVQVDVTSVEINMSNGGGNANAWGLDELEVYSPTLITVSGANNTTTLTNQGGTADLGTLAQTIAAASSTTGWQPLQYTITGLDLNGVGGTNDSVVVNLQVDAKRVDLRTGLGPFSDAGSTCDGSGEGIDLEFVSMVVNVDGGTDNGTATFKGFTGVTLSAFATSESATVNGVVYTAQTADSYERISLVIDDANADAIDYAFASGDGSQLGSFDFQMELILEPAPIVMLELASLFSDNMILQREKAVPVWGTSDPGAAITVEFAGQTQTTTAAGDGTWRVDLDSMTASADSRTLTVSAELDSVTAEVSFSNVLVGEVWLCSGQSNMWWPISKVENTDKAIVAATPSDPLLRFFNIPVVTADTALERLDAVWTESTTGTWGTAYNFSAVAYYFGLKLKAELGVPVGLIQSAIGATTVETWLPAGNDYNSTAGICYNGMIDAIIPFAMRGAIWYQGESNVMSNGYDGQPLTYVAKKKALINGWRSLWGDAFPFYYVQIAPYKYTVDSTTTIDDGILPFFWEAQSAIVDEITNTGMAVITDSVTATNGSTNLGQIHPRDKIVPGTRLALLALDHTYGQDIVSTGPVFQSIIQVGSTLEVTFDSAVGLTTSDSPAAPDGFEIAEADGVYVTATATVSGSQVILSAAGIDAPRYMRFAWSEVAQPNLRNAAGLVASSFRANVAPASWGTWLSENGLNETDWTSNVDGDSLNNLLEFAFGTDPSVSSGSSVGYGSGVTPGLPLPVLESGVDFRAAFGRRKDWASEGLTYTVQFSRDLSEWVDSAETPTTLESGSGDIDAVYVPSPWIIQAEAGFENAQFFRLSISQD